MSWFRPAGVGRSFVAPAFTALALTFPWSSLLLAGNRAPSVVVITVELPQRQVFGQKGVRCAANSKAIQARRLPEAVPADGLRLVDLAR